MLRDERRGTRPILLRLIANYDHHLDENNSGLTDVASYGLITGTSWNFRRWLSAVINYRRVIRSTRCIAGLDSTTFLSIVQSSRKSISHKSPPEIFLGVATGKALGKCLSLINPDRSSAYLSNVTDSSITVDGRLIEQRSLSLLRRSEHLPRNCM